MKKSLFILIILLVACGGSQENISDMSYQEPFISDSIQEMGTSRSMDISSGDYIIKTAYGTIEVSSSNFQNTINEFETLIITYKGLISNTYLQDLILKNSKNPVFDARVNAMLSYRNAKSLNKRFKLEFDDSKTRERWSV